MNEETKNKISFIIIQLRWSLKKEKMVEVQNTWGQKEL